MANYRNGGYDKTARTWVGILAVFMALVIAGAIALGVITKGFTDWSKFQPEEQQQEQTEEDTENPNESMILSEGDSNDFQLKSAPYVLTNAMTGESRVAGQTVSVKDPMSSFLTYVWSLSWSGSGDVNDYVTLSATTGTSVTVTCEEAFGSKITLTCKAMVEETELASATCTLDYRKRISGFTLAGKEITDGETISFANLSDLGFREAMKTNGYVFNFEPVYGIGTLEAELNEWSIQVRAGGIESQESSFNTNSFDLLDAITNIESFSDYRDILAAGDYNDAAESVYYKFIADPGFLLPIGDLDFYRFYITGSSAAGSTTVTFDLTLPVSMCSTAYTLELDKGNIIF